MRHANPRSRTEKSANDVRDFITVHIGQGLWKAGDRLPTERELGRQFGLSRNTLRRSLDALENEGLITRHVGRGTFVASAKVLSDDISNNASLEQRILRSSPSEVMEVRLILEPLAIERTALRANGEDFSTMDKCLRESEAAKSVAEFERWDGALHKCMMDASRNPLLATLYTTINRIRDQAAWGRLKERSLTPERRREYQSQHRQIVDALRDRDGTGASAALRAHLLCVSQNLLGH